MSGDWSIIGRTERQTWSIVDAMGKVCLLYGNRDVELGNVGDCSWAISRLRYGFRDFCNIMDEALTVIKVNWNEVIQNDALMNDVSRLFKACSLLQDAARRFDDCANEDIDTTEFLFVNCWLPRSYLVQSIEWYQRGDFINDFVHGAFKEHTGQHDPFSGLARRFRRYFTGVSDEELKAFIVNGIRFQKQVRWLQDKRQAVIFGQTLGIACKDMNKSFLFIGRDGMPRPLNYTADKPTNDNSFYNIYHVVDSIRREIRMMGKHQ